MRIVNHNIYSFVMGNILRHPYVVILAAGLAVALSLLLTARFLEFNTSRLDLISTGDRYKQLAQIFDREFEELPEGVVVVIRSEDAQRAKAFATALAQRWQGEPSIEKTLYRLDVESLKHKALFYLSPEDLLALRDTLQDHHALLEELATSPTLQNLLALINREITEAMVGHVFTGFLEEKKKAPPDLSLLLALLRQLSQSLDSSHAYQSLWATLFTKDAEKLSNDGFLWSEDKRLLFVLANPKKDAGDFNRFNRSVQQIRTDVRALQKDYPEMEVGVTGGAVLDADEMGVALRDTTIATVISAIGVTLLYVGMFKRVVRPLLALLTLGIGSCWVLGFTMLTVGHLNIFSIVFMPMLLGLGIDYGCYFLSRYEEERESGTSVLESLILTCRATCPGIATTAFTTALAFGTLLLTGSKGIAELGFIGASGILLIFLATYTILPAFLVLHERRGKARSTSQVRVPADGRTGFMEPLYRYPLVTLTASGLLMGLSLLALGRVGADFNLLHLQARGTESVVWAKTIFESSKRSLLFGELMAGSPEEVKRKAAALKAFPSVAEVESIATVIPEEQERKLPLIQDLRPLLAGISLRPRRNDAVDLAALGSILERIQFKMVEEGEAGEDVEDGGIKQQMRDVRHLIAQFVATMERMSQADVRQALSTFEEEVGRDLAEKLGILQANLRAEPVTLADLPPDLQTRYVGKHGQYRLFVYPAEDIWEFQPLSRFVKDLTSVDSDAFGTPVTNFAFTRGIKEAYQQAGLYAFLGICCLALLTFRAMRPTLLALIPLAVGALWTLGFMGLFEVKFNVANLIVLPLLMAPAVESGVMIVYRFREERGRSQPAVPLLKSTGRAVAFSALSTIIGFGSLMISRHWGIFSIGLLLAFGVSAVLLASLTVLPTSLTLLCTSKERRELDTGGNGLSRKPV